MIPPPFVQEKSDDDFNIKEHVVNIADGRLLRHRREFLGDVETSRERVTKVVEESRNIVCTSDYLQTLKDLYEETGEAPANFFLFYMGQTYRPKHVVMPTKSTGSSGRAFTTYLHRYEFLPKSHLERIDEEIKRLQAIVSSRVCDSVKVYDALCRNRFNLLQDVSRWLFAQQDILVQQLSSFYDVWSEYEDHNDLTFVKPDGINLYTKLQNFHAFFVKAVNDTRNLAKLLFGLGVTEEEESAEIQKEKKSKTNLDKIQQSHIYSTEAMIEERDKFESSAKKLTSLLAFFLEMTDHQEALATLRGGVELFNNMLQVLDCCYDELEKHDKILEQLQERMCEVTQELDTASDSLAETSRERRELAEKQMAIEKEMSNIRRENFILEEQFAELTKAVAELTKRAEKSRRGVSASKREEYKALVQSSHDAEKEKLQREIGFRKDSICALTVKINKLQSYAKSLEGQFSETIKPPDKDDKKVAQALEKGAAILKQTGFVESKAEVATESDLPLEEQRTGDTDEAVPVGTDASGGAAVARQPSPETENRPVSRTPSSVSPITEETSAELKRKPSVKKTKQRPGSSTRSYSAKRKEEKKQASPHSSPDMKTPEETPPRSTRSSSTKSSEEPWRASTGSPYIQSSQESIMTSTHSPKAQEIDTMLHTSTHEQSPEEIQEIGGMEEIQATTESMPDSEPLPESAVTQAVSESVIQIQSPVGSETQATPPTSLHSQTFATSAESEGEAQPTPDEPAEENSSTPQETLPSEPTEKAQETVDGVEPVATSLESTQAEPGTEPEPESVSTFPPKQPEVATETSKDVSLSEMRKMSSTVTKARSSKVNIRAPSRRKESIMKSVAEAARQSLVALDTPTKKTSDSAQKPPTEVLKRRISFDTPKKKPERSVQGKEDNIKSQDIRAKCLEILRQFLALGLKLAAILDFNEITGPAQGLKQAHEKLAAVLSNPKFDWAQGLTTSLEEYFKDLQQCIQEALSSSCFQTVERKIKQTREKHLEKLNQKVLQTKLKHDNLEEQYRALWSMYLQLCETASDRQRGATEDGMEQEMIAEDVSIEKSMVTAAEKGLTIPKGFVVDNMALLVDAHCREKISEKCLEVGRQCLETLDFVCKDRLRLIVRLYVLGYRMASTERLTRDRIKLYEKEPRMSSKWKEWENRRLSKLGHRFQEVASEMCTWKQRKASAIFDAWFLFNLILLETGILLTLPQPRPVGDDDSTRSRFSKVLKEVVKEKAVPTITVNNIQDVLSSGKLPVPSQQKREAPWGGEASLGVDSRRNVTQAVAKRGLAANASSKRAQGGSKQPPGTAGTKGWDFEALYEEDPASNASTSQQSNDIPSERKDPVL